MGPEIVFGGLNRMSILEISAALAGRLRQILPPSRATKPPARARSEHDLTMIEEMIAEEIRYPDVRDQVRSHPLWKAYQSFGHLWWRAPRPHIHDLIVHGMTLDQILDCLDEHFARDRAVAQAIYAIDIVPGELAAAEARLAEVSPYARWSGWPRIPTKYDFEKMEGPRAEKERLEKRIEHLKRLAAWGETHGTGNR